MHWIVYAIKIGLRNCTYIQQFQLVEKEALHKDYVIYAALLFQLLFLYHLSYAMTPSYDL